ncbi:MAG: hypothetical protein H6705_15510 [Myxococcales bacterium]|nr:hypothetical protein [Myxococcales bacterium]
MAAELMEMRRPVGVCTWVGRDVDDLAHVIMSEVEAEVADAGAGLDFRFEAPLSSAEMVARRVSDGRDGILQIISHAGEDGIMEVSDVWGSLSMTAENLARHLSGASVRVAVVVTCYGAKIAEALVQAKAVDVAVGMDMPLPFSVARAFSQGFYRGLARGRSIERAFADGQRHAAARDGVKVDRLRLFGEAAATGKAVFAPPAFYLVGTPSPARADVIDRLRAALAPHRVFHMRDVQFGADVGETLTSRLEMAQVVMVLFEGERIGDAQALEEVKTAIDEAQRREARVFPLYLTGTRPSRYVPFGLRRLAPLFVEDPRYGGDLAKVAAALEALVQ